MGAQGRSRARRGAHHGVERTLTLTLSLSLTPALTLPLLLPQVRLTCSDVPCHMARVRCSGDAVREISALGYRLHPLLEHGDAPLGPRPPGHTAPPERCDAAVFLVALALNSQGWASPAEHRPASTPTTHPTRNPHPNRNPGPNPIPNRNPNSNQAQMQH